MCNTFFYYIKYLSYLFLPVPPQRHSHTRGIINNGNTCYINALIQCISYIPQLNGILEGDTSLFTNLNNQLWYEEEEENPLNMMDSVEFSGKFKKLCMLH